MALIIGYLAVYSWFAPFWIYLCIIPAFILVTIFIPRGELDSKLVGKGLGLKGIKTALCPQLIYLLILSFLMGAFLFTFYTNIAMMITEKGMGTPADVGKVTAVNTFITAGVGFLYGFIMKFLKKYTLPIGFGIIALAFFILSSSTSLSTAIIGGMVFGLGAGFQQISTNVYVFDAVPRRSVTLAIALCMTMISLGISFSPIMVNTLKGAIFGATTATSSMMLAAGAYILLMIIEVVRETFFNKNCTLGMVLPKEEDAE